MRLLGRKKLDPLFARDELARKWVLSWVAEVRDAQWKHPADVADQFPKTRHDGNNHFVFPVENCKCAIHLHIAFPQNVALVTDLLVEDEIHAN